MLQIKKLIQISPPFSNSYQLNSYASSASTGIVYTTYPNAISTEEHHVDNNLQQGLAEHHEQHEAAADEAAEHPGAQFRAAQRRSHHERIPKDKTQTE